MHDLDFPQLLMIETEMGAFDFRFMSRTSSYADSQVSIIPAEL